MDPDAPTSPPAPSPGSFLLTTHLQSHFYHQDAPEMGPGHKINFSFPFQSLFPHRGVANGVSVPTASAHVLGAPQASQAISVPVLFSAWFGGLDPRLVLGIGGSRFALEELRERTMKLPSSSPQIPPPSSQGGTGTAGAARQHSASSKLIGLITCLPLLVRAPASLRL